MKTKRNLPQGRIEELFKILKARFEQNMHRHEGADWKKVESRLMQNEEKLGSLQEMEETGGEPDVIGYDKNTDRYIFCDCSPESPKGRRSLCYDPEALASRKENKPKDSAVGMAAEMGIELLNEEQFMELQQLGTFDTKTSSWIRTPSGVRALGGALFGDKRYGRTFIYHNGAESYYAARGFRGRIEI